MEPIVTRLLSAPVSLQFSDGSTSSVAAEVESLINALPVSQPRGGSVPVTLPTAPVHQESSRAVAFSGNPDVARWAQDFGLDPATLKVKAGAN